MKKRIILALLIKGFTSLAVQALLIREFLVAFYGNELTIGLILACWIISEALGSAASSRLINKIRHPFLTYSAIQSLISIYLPVGILLIREARTVLTATPGEALGIMPILACSLFIIAPLSILDGIQFPLGCRLYAERFEKKEQTAGRVYMLEAMGFILAGPVLTYIFLARFNSFQIGLFIGLINLASGLFLAREIPLRFIKKLFGGAILVIAALNLYTLSSGLALKIHNYSLKNQWKDQDVIEYKNSPYGNLAVAQKKEQFTFYSNGIPIINIPTPDITWTEEFVHFGMLSHPDPKKILFVGGGMGGPVDEALKHRVDSVDYAELDPLLIDLLKKFPKDITERELRDPRVRIEITDGVRFVKTTCQKYDIVFINLPPPSTLQLNRYYTKEFFARIKEILSPGGKLVLGLPGSLSYLNAELKQLNLCILATLKNTFSDVYVIPGDNNIYISSSAPAEITPQVFIGRIKERAIATKVLDEAHLRDRLKKYWQDWFYQNLENIRGIRENTNLVPSGVFYSIAYWNSLFGPSLKGLFGMLGKLDFNILVFWLIILEIILFILRNSFLKLRKIGISVSITTTGFAGMSLYMIFILSYQVFFGYVYHHIALLAASFMTGLALGSWLITKNLERIKKGLSCFIIMEISIAAFCLGAGLFLAYLNGIRGFDFYPVFYVLAAVPGFLVGAEFPLANKLYRQDNTYAKTAGILYAMDLLGGFLAALFISIIFLPIFGVFKTCLFLATMKSAGLVLFLPRIPQRR